MDLLSSIDSIFAYEDKALYCFHKKAYKDAFETFESKAADFLQLKNTMFDEVSNEDSNTQISELCFIIANGFIDYVKKDLEAYTGFKRFKKRDAQDRHNMYMVGYVFPFILKSKSDVDEKLCKCICDEWAKTFKNSNIQAASYEKILSGFQGKLFGMTVTHE